jgi:hypothetical protein
MRLKTKKIIFCILLSFAIIFIYNNLNYFQSQLIYKNFEIKEKYYSIFKTNIQFDINKNVLVFVHIQKTGGSDFDRNIVRHLLVYDKKKNDWNKACEFILNKTISKNIELVNEDENNNKLNYKTIDKTKKKVKFKKFACKRNNIVENSEPNW